MKSANIQTKRSTNEAGRGVARGRGRPREFDRNEGLAKAMRVFWALGYEATSMAELRKALGVKQASLYAAYGSKEQIFREAVDLYQRTDGVTTARALNSDLTTREAIHAMLQDAIDVFTAESNPGGCLVVLGTMNCSVGNKAVQDHLTSLRRETLKSIKDRLRRGQREGDVARDASIADIAEYFATVLHGLSIQSRDGSSRRLLIRVVQSAMSAWDHLTR